MSYLNLIQHSRYSERGTMSMSAIVSQSLKSGSRYAAISDHMSCVGYYEFEDECKKNNLTPIFGVTLEMAEGEFQVYAKNDGGLQSIYNIINQSKSDGGKVTMESLERYANNLWAVVGSSGGILERSYNKRDDSFGKIFDHLRGVFSYYDNSFSVGIERVNDIREDASYSNTLYSFAQSRGADLLALSTNRVYRREQLPVLQRKLSMIRPMRNIEELHTKNDYAKTESEMYDMFYGKGNDKHVRLLEVSSKLAEGYIGNGFSVNKKPEFPKIEGETLREIMRRIWVEKRDSIPKSEHRKYIQRIKDELDVIEYAGFGDYFIAFHKLAKDMRDAGVAYTIRGSGTGSLTCYFLGLTDLDPIPNGLLFERLLNKGRVDEGDLPDIDFDTGNVNAAVGSLDKMFNKKAYGLINLRGQKKLDDIFNDLVEMESNPTKKIRLNSISWDIRKSIPWGSSLEAEFSKNPKIAEIYASSSEAYNLINSALLIEAQVNAVQKNAVSFVVSNSELTLPKEVYNNREHLLLTPQNVEKAGLVKIDVLSNRVISDLRAAFNEAGIDYLDQNYDNSDVFKLFNEGASSGLFQIRSMGEDIAKDIGVKEFNDLKVLLALIRPGVPKEEIENYKRAKQANLSEYTGIPEADKILSASHGVIVFDEQIMKIAQDVGMLSADESDLLRRCIKNYNKPGMREKYNELCLLMRSNAIMKYEPEYVDGLLNLIDNKIGGYTFAEAHAISYAHICYKEAEMLVSRPDIYLDYIVGDNKEKLTNFVRSCESIGVDVLPASTVNLSKKSKVVGNSVYAGIKMVSSDTLRSFQENSDIKTAINRSVNRYLQKNNINAITINDISSDIYIRNIQSEIQSLVSTGVLSERLADQGILDIGVVMNTEINKIVNPHISKIKKQQI